MRIIRLEVLYTLWMNCYLEASEEILEVALKKRFTTYFGRE